MATDAGRAARPGRRRQHADRARDAAAGRSQAGRARAAPLPSYPDSRSRSAVRDRRRRTVARRGRRSAARPTRPPARRGVGTARDARDPRPDGGLARDPLPVREARLRRGTAHRHALGRDGEPRAGHVRRRVPARRCGARGDVAVRRRPRARAPVVRQPGDAGVVGRHLVERGLCRVVPGQARASARSRVADSDARRVRAIVEARGAERGPPEPAETATPTDRAVPRRSSRRYDPALPRRTSARPRSSVRCGAT